MTNNQASSNPIGTGTGTHTWAAKERAEEAVYAHQNEQEQLKALRSQLESEGNLKEGDDSEAAKAAASTDKDIVGGYGGLEDLEDRYATTSGEH